MQRERHLYWPCPTDDHPGTQRRYLDRVFPTPDGRARFLPRPHQAPREVTDHEFPLVLTTGRLYAHWHTLTRTAKCPKLVQRDPGPFVEVHPDDAARLYVEDGELVQLSSRRGTIRLPAHVSANVAPGLGIRAVPLGRPVRAGKRGQLPDDRRHRRHVEAARIEILCDFGGKSCSVERRIDGAGVRSQRCRPAAQQVVASADMNLREFRKAGHWPSLLSAFLYFDVSFMIWVLIGALAVSISADLWPKPADVSLNDHLRRLPRRRRSWWRCRCWAVQSCGWCWA